MNKMDRLAILCAVTPLICGILIFLLWLISRWESLKFLGFLVILGGLASVIVGGIAVLISLRKSIGDKISSYRSFLKLTCIVALLTSNFFAAGGIIAAVLDIETRYTIEISNRTQKELSSIRISGGGCFIEVPRLPAGASTTQHLYVKQDGSLEFEAKLEESELQGTVEGYVTNGLGGSAKIIVDEKQQLLIEHP